MTLLAVVVAGCGSKAGKPPSVTTPRAAFGWVDQALPTQGLKFQRPSAWRYTPGTAPLLATMTSGLTTIALWRYPRNEPLPTTPTELTAATKALVAAAHLRDSTFKVIKAKGTRAAHQPAVVIVADETVAGQPRRVRSTHIYAAASEIVVDAFAPVDQYVKVESPIFRTLVRSIQITAPTG
ncbi:MAG: hypothetical protein QOG68_508 [Solirubrobacteraceae bacterium]|jgi:hypothetical protein|nr:hypothetical protein [Solirubrobacteraceae bacterium]